MGMIVIDESVCRIRDLTIGERNIRAVSNVDIPMDGIDSHHNRIGIAGGIAECTLVKLCPCPSKVVERIDDHRIGQFLRLVLYLSDIEDIRIIVDDLTERRKSWYCQRNGV
jgi:hypothetical protein